MRHTNRDILIEALGLSGLAEKYTEDEVNSFQQWKALGYKVKRGEKAVLKVQLWYPSKYTKEDDKEETRFYMKTTALFTKDQVEPLEK